MRATFVAAVLLGLVVGGVIAGMRAFTGGSSAVELAPPGATPEPGSPESVAREWAAKWSADDPAGLYALLSPESQRALPLDKFTAAYDAFSRETTQTAVAVTVASVGEAQATLSVRLSTAYFGDFEYTIALAFTRPAGKPLVAWSPEAIHPAMVDGRFFKSDVQRPKRGTIFDRNGAPLAETRDVRMLGLNRAVVVDRGTLTGLLVEFGFTREQVDAAFDSKIAQNQRVTVGFVPDEKVEAAVALIRVPGVLVFSETQRVHPLGASAAHVAGYTRDLTAAELKERKGKGYRIGDRVGAVGLERTMDAVLAGKPGGELRLVDASGFTVETVATLEYVAGRNVTTTLDSRVLQVAAARLGSRAGAAVVIDPTTNAILALNSSPAYDPDAFERNDAAALAAITSAPGAPLTNRATAGLYSAGSTFKLVTGAAGLSSGLYRTTDQIYCGATWDGLDPPRKNWEGAQGPLTIALALMRSCNPVFYEIAHKLYNETDGALSKMARAFGFGAETGVVGLGEEAGLVPDAEWKRKTKNEAWFPGDEVNLGIGQGALLITPLQLANAYSAFVFGSLRTPVVLSTETAKDRGAIPLTSEQFAHLRQGLKLVTSATGTASAAFANAGYTDFAGKSGTAEDAGAQQHVLFVAYRPAAAPRAVAAVVLDEGQSGSVEAGPIARDILLAATR